MNFKYMLKRLPFSLIVWLIGGVTCGFVLTMISGAANTMSVSDFSLYSTYVPYIAIIICTIVTLVGCEQSFAGLVWSMIFSVILCIAFMYAVSIVETDPVVSAALLANSQEGTVITPAFHESGRVGIRFLVSILLPLVIGMVFSWAHKKRHPELHKQKAKNNEKASKSKKSKK